MLSIIDVVIVLGQRIAFQSHNPNVSRCYVEMARMPATCKTLPSTQRIITTACICYLHMSNCIYTHGIRVNSASDSEKTGRKFQSVYILEHHLTGKHTQI